jgi:hypothetical protein
MYNALGPLTGQYAYVLWIAGLMVLCFTLVQQMRKGGPGPQLPRPSAAQLRTMLAWLIIVVLAYIALVRIR